MRQPANRYIGYFYYFAVFILSILGLLVSLPYIYAVLAASLIFILFALFGCSIKIKVKHDRLAYLKLWMGQALGFTAWFIFAIFWFAKFPNYGNLTPRFLHHLSLTVLLSTFILVNQLNIFSYLMQRFQKPASVMLFFPNKKTDLRLAIYENICFRKATILTSLILLFFSASTLLPTFAVNAPLFLICLVISILFIKSPFFYRWLQPAIKQYHFNFVCVLLIVLFAFFVFYFSLDWLFKPFSSGLTLDLGLLGTTAPLVVFFGYAICITVPLAYVMPAFTASLNPKTVLTVSLINPLLWLLILLDFKGKLLPLFYHIPHAVLMGLSIVVLALSLYWLGSALFARLNVTFFMNDGATYQGKMPRLLVQNNIPIAFGLLVIFAFNAAIWLQIELLFTGTCVLLAYFTTTCIYLFRLRK